MTAAIPEHRSATEEAATVGAGGLRVVHVGDICYLSLRMCQDLRAAGLDAELLVTGDDVGQEYRLPGREWVTHIPGRGLSTNLRAVADLAKRRRRVDLFHGHGLMNVALMGLGRPYVAHVHGSDVREVACSRSAMGALFRRALRKAAHVFVSTEDLLRDAAALGLPTDRVSWLPNPVDPERFHSLAPPLDLRTGDEVVLCHPQRIQSVSRNEYLFQAYRRIAADHDDVVLYWVDHGQRSPDMARIEALVGQYVLEERTRRLPRVLNRDMPRLLTAADIIVDVFNPQVPRVSLTALESLLCERPVVAALGSGCYAVDSPIRRGNSPDEIEAALRHLLARREEWSELGQRGRAWVLERHHPGKVRHELCRRYLKAVAHG